MELMIVLAIVLGILAGIITGLIPGIHINLVATFVLIYSLSLMELFSIQEITLFILTMGVIHSFVDFIPSLLFGVPSTDTALSLLPGHQLVQEGRAYEALFLSAIGSFSGLIFAYILMFPLYFYLPIIYETIKVFIPYLLTGVLLILILLEPENKNKFWALIIVLLSGILGIISLNSNHLQQSLLVLFTGLFGISALLMALKDESKIPKQSFKRSFPINKKFYKGVVVGGLCSTICSISPGIGSAQAGTLSALFFRKIQAELFIVVLSAINTINFVISILTLYLLDRARNGAVFVIAQLVDKITLEQLIFNLIMLFFIAIIGVQLTLKLGKLAIKIIEKNNMKKLNLSIIIALIFLVAYISSWHGIIVLIAATTLGLLTLNSGVRRVHMMGVLLIPVILNLI